MRQDRMLGAAAVILLLIGVITVLSGHIILGGVMAVAGFGIFYLRGSGSFNDRSIYEKQIKTDVDIAGLYDKLKDMDTPLGKAWICRHKDYKGDCIIFGPDMFWDCVIMAKQGSNIVIKHTMDTEKIIRGEEDEHRFEEMGDPSGYEATPERYSIYAGFRLVSTVMLDHLLKLVEDISAGKDTEIPANLEDYRFYYHNSSEGWFKDSEGNDVLRVESSLDPFRSAVLDADGEEMASVTPRAFNKRGEADDSAGYELTANGEHYGDIRKFSGREGSGFIAETADGTFRAVLFPACRRGKISCNYRIEKDSKLAAVIAGSPNLIFDGIGQCRNDIILSYDDDYMVLYAILEIFILTLNSSFLK